MNLHRCVKSLFIATKSNDRLITSAVDNVQAENNKYVLNENTLKRSMKRPSRSSKYVTGHFSCYLQNTISDEILFVYFVQKEKNATS